MDYGRNWRYAATSRSRRRAGGRAKAALSILPVSGGSALDVGCGEGILLSALSSAGFSAEGFDVSSVAVAQARKRGVCANVSDIENTAIKGSYDAVFCLEVLEHLHRPVEVLRKLSEVLAPGGYIVVSLPNESNVFHSLKNVFAKNPAHLHTFNDKKAHKLFEETGLVVHRQMPLPLLPEFPGLGSIRLAFGRIWPKAFAISNIYLLSPTGAELDQRGSPK